MVIGSGFSEHSDPAALVVGPTRRRVQSLQRHPLRRRHGSQPDRGDSDAATRVSSAFSGEDVTANGSLNSPLGLALAPNGDVLSVNAGDGNVVETTQRGAQVAVQTLDSSGSPSGAGALFGLAIAPNAQLYYVDDASNTLQPAELTRQSGRVRSTGQRCSGCGPAGLALPSGGLAVGVEADPRIHLLGEAVRATMAA